MDNIPSALGLSSSDAQQRFDRYGPNEVREAPPHLLRDLALRFWGPVPWMLEGAFALELILGKVPEAIILLALLVFNAVLAEVQEHRAHEALELLRRRLQVNARVLRDGSWVTVPAREVVPGDRVHLRMGDIVPADGRVVEGDLGIDQSVITGESAEVRAPVGSLVYSGSTVRGGTADIEVTATGAHSFYGKTAELVRTAKSEGHLERLLFSIVRYLVALDTALALLMLFTAELRGVSLAVVLPFVLILLIASVPVALPATFTIANTVEARRLVEQGVLVTGLSAVQEAASMEVLCVDKTGTLTEGRESFRRLVNWGGLSEDEVLSLAGATCDPASSDTIDTAVLREVHRRGVSIPQRLRAVPFDPARKLSEAWVQSGGTKIHVVLGAPDNVIRMCGQTPPGLQEAQDQMAGEGARVIMLAAGTDGALEAKGLLALADAPRADAFELIRSLRAMGVRVIMLTGDSRRTAEAIAHRVGLGDRIGDRALLTEDPTAFDGFAGVYPEDKFHLVQALQRHHRVVGMTGDGVNDAPALKQAEVGIAVSNSTDVARSAARLVLTRPGLADIVSAVRGGRLVYRRMLSWTLNKLSKNIELVLLLTLGFVFAGLLVTTPFLILVMIFANDFVTMSVGSDNARVSTAPDRWDIREILATSAVIGGAWLALSFGLLWWAFHVAQLPLATLQTFFFVYLVLSSQGTLLLVREKGPCWSSRPATPLIAAMAADDVVIVVLALTGTLMAPLSMVLIFLLFLVVVAGTLGIDQVKLGYFRKTDAFGPRSIFHRKEGPLSKAT